jgi:UDP-GlcNAc:undecaprenyl-phosphate/decaprenyl-phosphate GlcNAc-1-phosphate transferase
MWFFLTSFLISALVAPVVIKLYNRRKWVDDPKKNHHAKVVHTKAVTRGGGVVVFFGIAIASLFLLEVDKYLIAILCSTGLLMLTGIWDDVKDISPFIRLGVGFLAALIVVGAGIGIAYVTNPFGDGVIHLNWPQLAFTFQGIPHTIWIWADIFALIFILWNMNIVNWSKGVDGQMPGFVSIAALMIGFLSYRFIDDPTQFNTAHLSFITAGAFAGLLVWNWYPQKILPGYGAGSIAGFMLGVLAILSGAKVAAILMVLAVPTADAIFTISRRIIAGKSPFLGDRGHLHHKLLDVLGWSIPQVAAFYWSSSFLLGFLSLYLNTTHKLITISAVGSIVFAFLVWAKLGSGKGKKK